MATIEERARQYATNHVGAYECGAKGNEWDSAYDNYVEIANEQKEVDIDKACKWIEDHFGESYIEYFKKAMDK